MQGGLWFLTLSLAVAWDSTVVEILSRVSPPGEPLVSIPLGTPDGGVSGALKIYEGDEPADAVAA